VNFVLGNQAEDIEKHGKDVISPGWRKKGTWTPKLIWLRIPRGKAQPRLLFVISSLVPDLCPTPPCRVRWKKKEKILKRSLLSLVKWNFVDKEIRDC